ncbi:hypothetical protein LWI29_029210 [Acer saccharum]|uniref:Pentatricopeptide repeat-containing protein n=1 Tax=Acer saccharum TaxID=4024 RepID=A0AA39VXF2_ACESA|nr:hypothetical protein LWI29_029210 [Acer saccharum]
MANDGDSGLPADGGNRSLEEFRISHTILERKVDSISNDLRRTIDTLRVVTENLKIREDRAPPVRRAYVSPMGARGQRRARRHVQPAPPEFSESDEGGICHRRYCGRDSSTDEEVEQWILGEPRFAAQPRFLHHNPPTSSSSSPYTHKTPNPKFDNTHENQFKTTETCSRFSLETHPPSQFHDQQNAINPICETQSTETHFQPQNSASTHDPCKKNQISQRRDLVDLDLHSSKEDYKSVAPLDSKNRQQHFDLSNSENKLYQNGISVAMSREVFDKMPEIDLVSWNVMISGYLRNKNLSEAWELFESMPKRAVNTFVELQRHEIEPNEFTFSSFIKGCANQAALDQGIQLAAQVIRFNFDRNPFVSSILVDMYGKCGLLDDSIQLFDDIDNPTEFAWNSWISVFAQHGLGKEALETLDRMIHRGVKPTAITFVSLLTGCSHVGLIDEVLTHFYSMEKTYGLVTREEFIKNMPFEPNAFGWCSFLRACRIHSDKEIVVDESTEVVLKSGNSVQGQLVDCFEVVKNVGENVKNVEEDDKIVFPILGIFTQPMVEAIDLGDAKDLSNNENLSHKSSATRNHNSEEYGLLVSSQNLELESDYEA